MVCLPRGGACDEHPGGAECAATVGENCFCCSLYVRYLLGVTGDGGPLTGASEGCQLLERLSRC